MGRVRGDAFRDVKSMHVDLVTDPAIIDYLDEAKRQGVMISMTCGWPTVEAYRGKQVALREMLQRADLLFCNEIEAVGLSGTDSVEEAMGFFREVGCHPVITLGAEGAVTLDEAGQVLHEKALAVELVDPTGAGDSFAVGFMTGVILGWPMAKALRLGVVCGSLSVTALGGTEGFPRACLRQEAFFRRIVRRRFSMKIAILGAVCVDARWLGGC